MMPLLVTAIGAYGLPHPRSPRPEQHIKEHSADSPQAQRRSHVEVTPEIADYIVGSIHDDAASGMRGMGLQWSWWQPFLSIVSLIAMVNSIIAGVLAALIVAWTASPPVGVVVVTGLVVALVVFGCHLGIGLRVIGDRERMRPPMFPAP